MTGPKYIILYHADWDGITSAYIVLASLPPGINQLAETIPVQYNKPPPKIGDERPHLIIVDFSYPPEELEALADRCQSTIVIDHHKTAIAQLTDFSRADVELIMEDGTAGCELTWDRFWPDYRGQYPWVVRYVADRDVWRWDESMSKEVNANIRTYPQTLEHVEMIAGRLRSGPGDPEFQRFINEGAAVLRYQNNLLDDAVHHAKKMRMNGSVGYGTNLPCRGLISDAAGELAEREDAAFGCCWFHDGKQFLYSLRSRGGCDVSQIASEYPGGGGHKAAAGFNTTKPPWEFYIEEDEGDAKSDDTV